MTNSLRTPRALIAAAIVLASAGCAHVPGTPTESADVSRPDKQLDFHALYKQNCSGCHGENGRGGAAIPLNNPAYLAVAGTDNIRTATAKGMSSTMMPAFAESSGGMLTDAQVDALVQGMAHEWSRPADFSGIALPPYSSTTPGNPTDGEKAYAAACARCHGADGKGIKTPSPTTTGQLIATPHSIVDPSYLALVNDQNLRSYVIAGHIDDNAPDWRSYTSGHALTPQEITDIVAWLAQHRAPVAQQSIDTPRTNPPGVAKTGPAKKEIQ
jgi:cytochrome c oxidase cbb3-type subunit 3/ubiquinol-cytochrome c reductase cytochrome c subunit